MNTKLLLKSLLLSGVALNLLAACTTSGSKVTEDRLKGSNAVVQQGGRREPVVSSHDRSYWLDQRQSKSDLPKMSGALATGEANAAVEIARSHLAKRPGDAEALSYMATALAMSKNFELAAYYATLLDKVRPGDSVALNIKGMAAMHQNKARIGDFRKAQGYFEQAFTADAGQIAAGLNLASLQLETGNAGGAAQTFGEVAKRCNQCTVALMGYGIASSRSKKYDAAKGAFEAVLAKNPISAAALYNLALVHKNGYNNRKQAEKYLDRLLADSRIKDATARERAQTVLRSVKSEASVDERTMIADDADANDAELLMTTTAPDAEDE